MDLLSLFRAKDRREAARIDEDVRASNEWAQAGGDGKSLRCTYCGGTDFYEGPSGGMSTNVLCANSNCRHWFNWTEMLHRLDDQKRIEPTADEKAQQEARHRAERDEKFAGRMNEGREFYRVSRSTAAMRMAQRERQWTYPQNEHFDQLCGFIDALCDEVHSLKDQLERKKDDNRNPQSG
jgi:hypothetical protein